MSNNDSTDRLQALAGKFVTAYNDKDFERLRELLAPKFYFEHHNRNFQFSNADEFVATLKQFASELMTDRAFGKATRISSSGNTVVIEQPWSGTPSVDIPGMAAAGERLSLDLCSVFIFEGELVAEYHDYG